MRENFLFAFLGIVAGWLVNQVYARHSSKELRDQYASVIQTLAAQTKYLEYIAQQIEPTHPLIAEEIKQSVKTGIVPEFQLGAYSDGESCPNCKTGKVHFMKFGRGPLGIANAWFGCDTCNYQFQTQESAGD